MGSIVGRGPRGCQAGDESGRALAVERRALASTLRLVGADAPTAIAGWTAADLAAHLAATEKLRGVPTFLGRQLVARYAIRLNDAFRSAMDLDRRRFRRRGFEWALHRLEGAGPALLTRPSVLPVSVFEVFVHHEDVRRPNGAPRAIPPPELTPTVAWLLRYQRRRLGGRRLRVVLPDGRELLGGGIGPGLTVAGDAAEVVLWLAGRHSLARVTVEVDDGADLRMAEGLGV